MLRGVVFRVCARACMRMGIPSKPLQSKSPQIYSVVDGIDCTTWGVVFL